MTALWGSPWGTLFGPPAPVDQLQLALGTARARLLEDPTFKAYVRVVGLDFADIQTNAWLLEQHIGLSTAMGVMLDRIGDALGLARLSTAWNDTVYRRILGAWYPAEYGAKSIPKLAALLAALAHAGGQTYTYQDLLPCAFQIVVIGLDDDDAKLWAQVLDAARPKGVKFWLEYSSASPFTFDESYFGGGDVLAGQLEIG